MYTYNLQILVIKNGNLTVYTVSKAYIVHFTIAKFDLLAELAHSLSPAVIMCALLINFASRHITSILLDC